MTSLTRGRPSAAAMLLLAGAIASGCGRPLGRPPPAQDAAPRPSVGAMGTNCGIVNDDPRCVGEHEVSSEVMTIARDPIAPAPLVHGPGKCLYPTNVALVRFKPGTTQAQLEVIARSEGGRVYLFSRSLSSAKLELQTMTQPELDAALDRLRDHPQITGVGRDTSCGHRYH